MSDVTGDKMDASWEFVDVGSLSVNAIRTMPLNLSILLVACCMPEKN